MWLCNGLNAHNKLPPGWKLAGSVSDRFGYILAQLNQKEAPGRVILLVSTMWKIFLKR